MIQLSIIIPAYNIEKYIEKCIRSLYSQELNLAEYEVIVIDDGSPDNLNEIVKNLQKEFNNLRLIRQENKHAGGARNTGIREAQGKYILFVDPDDYVLPNTLLYLLDRVEKEDLDVLATKYSTSKSTTLTDKKSQVLTGGAFLKEYGYSHCIWLHIIRKDLLTDNKILFREKIGRHDGDFMAKVIFYANRIQYIPFVFYVYLIREGSITQTFKVETLIADVLMNQAINDFNESIVRQKDKEAYKVLQRTIWYSLHSYTKGSLKYSLKDIRRVFKTIQNIGLLDTLYPINRVEKVQKILIQRSPFIYSVSLHLLKIFVWFYRLRFKCCGQRYEKLKKENYAKWLCRIK